MEQILTIVGIVISSGTLITLIFYRPRLRKENAEATGAEQDNEKKHIDWLEGRINQRDEKVDVLYQELRAAQEARLNALHTLHEAQLTIKDLEHDKCKRDMCPQRIPPRTDEAAILAGKQKKTKPSVK